MLEEEKGQLALKGKGLRKVMKIENGTVAINDSNHALIRLIHQYSPFVDVLIFSLFSVSISAMAVLAVAA